MLQRMIRSLQTPPPRHAALADTAAPAVPAWLRRAVSDAQDLAGKDSGDMAIVAGAALGALDWVVRRRERWAGAWRQRLGLVAAASTVKQAGRVEDEAALRDVVLLTRPGDAVGPAGLLLLAWRRLAARPAPGLLMEESLAALLEEFGYAPGGERAADLAAELRQLDAGVGMVAMLTGAFTAAERHGYGRFLGAWLADALLARRLGWAHAVPLMGTQAIAGLGAGKGVGRSRRAAGIAIAGGVERANEEAGHLLAAQARAALYAIDLSAELGRRAERLLAVAPKLRARASDLVVERLLCDDAVVASERIAGISDRGLRRLFDRLVGFGAVRELSGRPTFRSYGL